MSEEKGKLETLTFNCKCFYSRRIFSGDVIVNLEGQGVQEAAKEAAAIMHGSFCSHIRKEQAYTSPYGFALYVNVVLLGDRSMQGKVGLFFAAGPFGVVEMKQPVFNESVMDLLIAWAQEDNRIVEV
jgi:hypothetical protein